MVDSGWYKHPYFVARGYRAATPVIAPGASNPLTDPVGHGTGESANILLRRSRRAVPAGEDEFRQHRGRVQRRGRPQSAHHHVQLGEQR